jgi:hypothetical protein
MTAVPQIVILNDLFYTHEAFFARLDLLQQFSEVAMCLAATAFDLIVVVAVPRYQVDDYLVGDKVFPVCAGYRAAVVQHHLGAIEVYSPLLEQMFDLLTCQLPRPRYCRTSTYRMILQCLYCFRRRGYYFSYRWV